MNGPRGAVGRRVRQFALCSMLVALTAILFGLGARSEQSAALADQAAISPSSAWVQLGLGGDTLIRAVNAGAGCPALTVGGVAWPMTVRAAAAPPEFPLNVCEAALPTGAAADLVVGGARLPAPRPRPSRIVVIGDAGCRLEEGDPIQDCSDPRAWPFAQIAASAAAWHPDLVLHVGDYVYREEPCPPKLAECAGSPWGDTWAAWQADLLAPAAPLLRAASWVFTRGNHELCSRGGDGGSGCLIRAPTRAPAVRITRSRT